MVKVISVNTIKRKPNIKEIVDSLDNKYILSLDTIIIHSIKGGMEYTEQEWDNILINSDKQIGLNTALYGLSLSPKTEKEIREKLRHLRAEAIEVVVARLFELRYLDDVRYAEDYVNSYKDTKGSLRLKSELIHKGIDKEIIDTVLQNIPDEQGSCIKVAKKFIKNNTLDLKLREKLMRHLLSRGFSYEMIKSAINKLGGLTDDLSDI